jgi:transcriptional regulator with XRE-family HTH domain
MRAEKAFGIVLRNLRTERGLSQDRLAIDAGVDRTFVSMLERGTRQPTLDTMLRLASALGVSLSSLASMVEEAINQ